MALFVARCVAFSLPALAIVLGVAAKQAAAADIAIVLDEARLVKLPDRVATLIIGNPTIADATVQSGGLMVVTGKGYGATNIIAIDRTGAVLMERTIEVQAPRGNVVVVYKGVEKESYSCTPHCDRRFTLGDGTTFFEATGTQISTRNALAASGVVVSK